MTNETVVSRPPPADRRWLLWVSAAAALQLAFLLWAARASVQQALHCDVCDTAYYYTAAAEIAKAGLLFTNPYEGYRSYFVPLFIAAVSRLAALPGLDGGTVVQYTYGVTILFWLVCIGLMGWLAQRGSMAKFLTTTAATLLNPFLVVYVPFALQEGVLMFFCLPLMFLWVGAKDLESSSRAALVMLMAVLAYIIRAALVWWLLPAVLYAAWLIRLRIRQPRRWLPWMSGVAFAGILLVGPQIYISKQHSDSFNPYPSTTVFSQQIPIGITLLKFATVEDEGHWRGLTYWSPYVAEPEEDKTFRFYVERPARGAFLMLTHAFAGFHYDQVKPYWQLDRARPFTLWLALSSAIVFLGVVRMATLAAGGELDADRAYAIGTLVLCVASLLFVAAESRFGIIGFAMLSIQVAEWIATRPSRAQVAWLVPGLLLYLALSFLYNTLLLQSADIRL